MVAYSFQKRFAYPILAGTKCQTIRDARKRHARPGEALQLYTGMRTRQCSLIGTARCMDVQPIVLDLAGGTYRILDMIFWDRPILDEFAQRDGFEDWTELRAFWESTYPGITDFGGFVIRWQDFKPAGAAASGGE